MTASLAATTRLAQSARDAGLSEGLVEFFAGFDPTHTTEMEEELRCAAQSEENPSVVAAASAVAEDLQCLVARMIAAGETVELTMVLGGIRGLRSAEEAMALCARLRGADR